MMKCRKILSVIMTLGLMVMLFAAVPAAAAEENLLPGGKTFEGWYNGTTADVTEQNTPYAGYDGKIFTLSNASWTPDVYGLEYGETYEFSGWFRPNGTGTVVQMAYYLYNADGSLLQNKTYIYYGDLSPDVWVYRAADIKIPARPAGLTLAEDATVYMRINFYKADYAKDYAELKVVRKENLISNGQFSGTADGWTLEANTAVSAGALKATCPAATAAAAVVATSPTFSLENGASYRLSYRYKTTANVAAKDVYPLFTLHYTNDANTWLAMVEGYSKAWLAKLGGAKNVISDALPKISDNEWHSVDWEFSAYYGSAYLTFETNTGLTNAAGQDAEHFFDDVSITKVRDSVAFYSGDTEIKSLSERTGENTDVTVSITEQFSRTSYVSKARTVALYKKVGDSMQLVSVKVLDGAKTPYTILNGSSSGTYYKPTKLTETFSVPKDGEYCIKTFAWKTEDGVMTFKKTGQLTAN